MATNSSSPQNSDAPPSDSNHGRSLGASLRRRLFRAASSTALGKLVSTTAVLINYRLLSSYLTDEGVTAYLVVNGLAAIGALVAGLGLGPLVMRRLRSSQMRGEDSHSHATILRGLMLNVPASLVIGGLLWILISTNHSLFQADISQLGLHAAGWLVAMTLCQYLAEALRGYERFSASALISGLNGGVLPNILLTLYLLIAGSSVDRVESVLLVQVLAMVIAAGIGATQLRPLADRDESVELVHRLDRPERTRALEMLPEGLPILVNQLSVIGVTHFEVLLLGMYAPPEDAAAYGAVRRLMLLVGAPLMLLNASLPTFIVELFTQGKREQLQKLLRSAATAAMIPAAGVLATITLLPTQCLCFFDPDYASAWPALLILAAANLVFVLAGSCGLTLRMTGFERWSMASGLTTGALYLALAPWAAANYSLPGIATATGVLLIVRNVVGLTLVRQLVGVWCVPWISLSKFSDALRQLLRQPRHIANDLTTPSGNPSPAS